MEGDETLDAQRGPLPHKLPVALRGQCAGPLHAPHLLQGVALLQCCRLLTLQCAVGAAGGLQVDKLQRTGADQSPDWGAGQRFSGALSQEPQTQNMR